MERHRSCRAPVRALLLVAVLAFAASAGGAWAAPAPKTPPDPAEPNITITWPPLLAANVGIPTEHLHLKLNQAVTPLTLPVYFCLPGTGFEGVLPPIHLVWKPGGIASVPPMSPSDLASLTGITDPDAWPSLGVPGVPVPRDALGTYELEVFCLEFTTTVPPAVMLGRQSTAYSVEPEPYRAYVEADNPVAYWRLGDLPKGSTALADSAGSHDGIYYADGGNHPALDRDGAPNCNVESRATTGCNDGVGTGITSDVLSDDDRAAFFMPGQYAAVQDFAAITSAYTVEAWVRPFAAGDMMIFQHGRGPALYVKDGRFVFRQTETDVTQTGGDLPAAGDWFHVVGTWDGVNTARLYVNGVEVGSSTSAPTPPSGFGSTLYIGNGELTGGKTFHGSLDEVAYYAAELPAERVARHYEIGTYVQPGDSIVNPLEYYQDVTRPKVVVNVPTEDAVFNAGKVPSADYEVSDADGLLLDGVFGGDIVACVPLSPMDGTPGAHTYTIACTDRGGNVKTVSRHYTVADFPAVVTNADQGLVGYWRLGDAPDSSVMGGYGATPDGEYKNDTAGGPTGIAGDADSTRAFLGAGGYGYVNGIAHPRWEYSMEAWVELNDADDAMILQHGRGGALFVHDDRIVFRQTDADVVSTVSAASLIGGYHQIAGTWDGVYARLYVDGALQGSAVYAPTPPSGSSTFYVGYGEYAPWLNGNMDEVSYYSKALSSDRIYEHFRADPPPPAPTHGSAGDSRPVMPTVRVVLTPGRLVAVLGLRATCPARATGPCRVVATLHRRPAAKYAKPLARRTRTLAAGRRWQVRLPLTRRAARTLRTRGRLAARAGVSVRAPHRKAIVQSVRLTLRAP